MNPPSPAVSNASEQPKLQVSEQQQQQQQQQQQLQQQQQQQQQQPPLQQSQPMLPSNDNQNTVSTTLITSVPTVTGPQQTLATAQVQQAPLALITQTQTQSRPVQVQTPPQLQQSSVVTKSLSPQTMPVAQLNQSKPATSTPSPAVVTTEPAVVANPQSIPMQTTATAQPSSTGPTALVIIPQHSNTTLSTPSKTISTITTKPVQPGVTPSVNVTAAHVALSSGVPNQSTPIQLHTPLTTHVPNIAPIPITAHQQSITPIVQPTLTNRPPSAVSVVPLTTTPANVKSEPNKYICCLLDNGVRCDRAAGNASFSARIQKIVGTKKMNFALDPTVRHAYICEHHKAIITVAKKSTTFARDTKANARNYTANNNTNTISSQPDLNSNEFSIRQGLKHPVNLELLNNQNRIATNHTGSINSMPIRPGAQMSYNQYSGNHQNQVGFDGGGDTAPSSSGGVEVDLQQLQVNTLRRYKRHFRVQTKPGLNKLQLAESLKGHFRTLPIIEKEAITYFVYIVKCYRNKLDHNPKAD